MEKLLEQLIFMSQPIQMTIHSEAVGMAHEPKLTLNFLVQQWNSIS